MAIVAEKDLSVESRQLMDRLPAEISPIVAGTPVLGACLHGSYAVGQTNPFSDLDIALVTDGSLTGWEETRLQIAVATDLESRCPDLPEMDARIIDSAPLTFQGRMLYYGSLLYARDEDYRVEFRTRVRMAYFDHQPTEAMICDAFLQRTREWGLHGGHLQSE